MDLTLTPAQEMLQASARDFLAKECPPSLVRAAEADPRGYPPELWAKVAALGWAGLLVGQEYGGAGATLMEAALLMEEAGRAALPGPLLPVLWSGVSLQEASDPPWKSRLLPSLARGEIVICPALTEPRGAPVQARADGLWGTKLFVPYAGQANYLMVSAQAPQGEALFLVDSPTPGLSITPLPTTAADHQFEVRLEGAVGQPLRGAGGRVADAGTMLYCAQTVGHLQAALELSVQYVKERHQFGRPIGSFQAVHHHLTDMYRDLQVARLLTYQAAWRLAQGQEAKREVSIARLKMSSAVPQVTSLAHQVHGGVGFYTEYPLELHYRRALAGAVALGGVAPHRERLVGRLRERGEGH